MEDFKDEYDCVFVLLQQMCNQVASISQCSKIASPERLYYETLHEVNDCKTISALDSMDVTEQNNVSILTDSNVLQNDNVEIGNMKICDNKKNSLTTDSSSSALLSQDEKVDKLTDTCVITSFSSSSTSIIKTNRDINFPTSSCTNDFSLSNSEVSSSIEMTVESTSCSETVCNSAESLFPPIENKDSNCNIENTSVLKPFSHETVFQKVVGVSSQFETGNFFKGCKWAPDGLCFFSNSNDNLVRIFNTPYQCLTNEVQSIDEPLKLEACLKIKEPGTIYDFCWWPLMNSNEPVTCCFATAASDQPIHLWDAFDGKLRASYIALNSVQEIASPYSLCFNNDGQQLLCGFKKDVCLFYTDRPGADYERWSTMKKKKRQSQNNIISCMEFCQDDTMFACGSYDGTVGLYSPVNGHLLDFTAAHSTGVTWLKFSKDGYRLYTGARKGDLLKSWDIRNLRKPFACLTRPVSTNQRIYFDIVQDRTSQSDLFIVSGSTDGNVYTFNISETIGRLNSEEFYEWKIQDLDPKYVFKAHNDCVNGCNFHPFLPLLLTTSGQRNYPNLCENDDCDVLIHRTNSGENTVKMWHLNNSDAKQTSGT